MKKLDVKPTQQLWNRNKFAYVSFGELDALVDESRKERKCDFVIP